MKINPWHRIAVTAGAVVLVALLASTWRFLDSHGVFTAVHPGFAGTCRAIGGINGPGDIAVDAQDKTAFVAARDGIYAYAYAEPDAKLVKLAGAPKDFHPGGISLFRASDGSLTLMAINRRGARDNTVEVFSVEKGAAKLEQIGSISGDVLVDPADLAAVDQDRFYVVNRHTSRTALGCWLDDVLVLPRADILYFDGFKFVPIIGRLNAPGGAALSADGQYLFVTEDYPRTLLTFERMPFSGRLTQVGALSIPSGLARVSVAAGGNLWVAGDPKAFAMDRFRRDPSKPAPSEVFRITAENGVPREAVLVYANAGGEIGGASAAAMTADGHLLIGSSLDDKMLDCRLWSSGEWSRKGKSK